MRLSLLLTALLALAIPAMAASSQTIRIDDEHLQVQRADGKDPPLYLLHPAESVDLIAAGYQFRIPAALQGKHPNSVQLILGKNQAYSAPWPADSDHIELSQATLVPNPGSIPFSGFTTSASGAVAVGVLDEQGFSVVWVGMFSVQ